MSTEPQRTCSSCGNELSGAMEFCPVCMLRKGLAGGVESGESSSEDAVKPTPEQAAQRFEHYELVTGEDGKPIELGRGAMGITYKALDVDLRCPVTLKVISEKYVGDESARLRFLREARAAAKVRHTNVASVFHLGRNGSSYFYAMEFVEGETLEKLIKRSGRLELKLALEIATQVAAGLAAIHEQNLVHRDIKPTNIMVRLKEEEGSVTAKIIDLGLAKGVSEPGTESAISTPGAFAGTPEFASPEQFAGVQVDIRSDLYSLGVTLWEMLTGNAPFRGTPGEVMHQHQHAPLPLERLEDVPQPVVALLEVLLEKDPARRFQNPTDLLKAVPLVMRAVKARRAIKHQNLRTALVRELSLGPKKLPTISVPKRSIAVLPFDTLSQAKGNTYFADGVQDEILSNLAKVSQLKVISRTSVMPFRPGDDRNLRSIAESLGVANVVEGTVRRDGKHVRITIRLVNARTDETLWSDTYDRNLTDIFAIQSDVAQKVAAKLSARLSPEEKKGIVEKPTANLEAYDLYLQAKELVVNRDFGENWRGNLLKAIRLLEEATRKDPKFTLALCLVARAHDDLYLYWLDKTPERRVLGDAAVNEALRLEPDRPEAHLAMAYHLYSCYRNYERASVQIAIAQRGLPNSPEALWLNARIGRRQGRWDESTKALEKAYTLDPRNSAVFEMLWLNYCALRRYGEAEQIHDRLSVIEPDKPLRKIEKPFVAFLRTGDASSYRAALDRLPSSMKDHGRVGSERFWFALYARDWTTASQILGQAPDEDLYIGDNVKVAVPRGCGEIWLAALQGQHPTMEGGFGAARDQLAQRVEAHPEAPQLLSVLGVIDALLGRKQEAIQEVIRAVEIQPISKDALEGTHILQNLATAYAWTNEPDFAFKELTTLVETPDGMSYGQLKLDPAF
jgi:serine/threonine protein kinase